ncbi:MAG TPA: aminoacyl-tRNA hydrolase [Puia sp.]|nr:aminoacyl-tRNA hydrolase [Puia sp.]
MSKFLIAGLGNIGAEYAGTRHNIGFDVVDILVQKHGGRFVIDRLAAVASIKYKGTVMVCIKPTTYMNLSGRAVKYWMDKEKITVDHTLVIADDIALPLSKLRLRPGGSAAGHNGLRSVEEALATENYPRLRFGVGNDFPKGRQVEYVLGRWKESELPLVRIKAEKCVDLIETWVFSGLEKAMNEYNKLEITL